MRPSLRPSFQLRSLAAACVALGLGPAGLGLAACEPAAPAASAASSHSKTLAPDFTGRDLAGKTFRLSDHLGKEVVLLDFWSTYCEPCKAEFPQLGSMYGA